MFIYIHLEVTYFAFCNFHPEKSTLFYSYFIFIYENARFIRAVSSGCRVSNLFAEDMVPRSLDTKCPETQLAFSFVLSTQTNLGTFEEISLIFI